MSTPLSLFAFENQEAMPSFLANWLTGAQEDPLSPIWVVVSSAAVRQRLEWDLSEARTGDSQISSNMRYMFPEEFVRTVETCVLEALGITRHEWNPQNIAARLIGLSEGSSTWGEALKEAESLDEIIRWRRDVLNQAELPRLTRKLLDTEEWRSHGALVQRDLVLTNLKDQSREIARTIVFFGLESAPGGSEFVRLVKAVSEVSSVAVLTVYPDLTRLDNFETVSGISWWASLDQHLEVWKSTQLEFEQVSGEKPGGQLGHLQTSLMGMPTAFTTPSESIVQIFGGVGPSRQVEMARDYVIGLLEEGKCSAPEKILVTSTSLEKFIPHIERHWSYNSFGRIAKKGVEVRLPRLAHEITESTSDGMRSRALCVGELLNLIGNYVSISQIESLLQFENVRENLKLEIDAVLRISELSREGRVAFGVSPDQRAGFGVFPEKSNVATWQRFFDRLAMTAMLPDSDSPDQLGVSTDLELIAGLHRLTSVLQESQNSVVQESVRSIAEWIEWIGTAFSDVIERGRSRDDSFEKVKDNFYRDFEWGGSEIRVPFDFFREYWNSLVASRTIARNFGRFGVHVAPISALTSASYEFVVILGLDEENLPNASIVSPTFDPPRIGDPNPRRAVLASLLLTILSARKGLAITYSNRNELTGQKKDRSMVLSELFEHLHKEVSLIEGPRHGFVSVAPASTALTSYDARYEGAGELIKQASFAEGSLSSRVAQLEDNVDNSILSEIISIQNLSSFLNDSAKHFIMRGLLGAGIDRARSIEIFPRLSIDSLAAYQIREELIRRLSEYRGTQALDEIAPGILDEILSRESIAADIPKALISHSFNLGGIILIASRLRDDYACYTELTVEEETRWYRDIELDSGAVIALRSGQPDEINKWTVYRDFSKRQSGVGGGPAIRRFHPTKTSGIKEFRVTLTMLIDLLAMKINQPEGEEHKPISTIFFASEGKKGGNPQVSYRFEGTREQALLHLEEIVRLFQTGAKRPIAIGRYALPVAVHKGDQTDGFFEDMKDPTFKLIFGEDPREFEALSAEQGIQELFKNIFESITWSRETATQRTTGRVEAGGQHSEFKPILLTEKVEKKL